MKKFFSLLLCVALLVMSTAVATEPTWTCEACGTEGLTRNFCPNCGAARPSAEWTCPNCGSVNESRFCPECGTQKPDGGTRPASNSTPEPELTMQPPPEPTPKPRVHEGPLASELMTPTGALGHMDECIRTACVTYGLLWQADADELYAISHLGQSGQENDIISLGNADRSIEMAFVYGEGQLNVDAPAEQVFVAMRQGSTMSPGLSRLIAASSVVTLLSTLDQRLDIEAVTAMIGCGEDQSAYEGNGYRLTLIVVDDSETQLCIELT